MLRNRNTNGGDRVPVRGSSRDDGDDASTTAAAALTTTLIPSDQRPGMVVRAAAAGIQINVPEWETFPGLQCFIPPHINQTEREVDESTTGYGGEDGTDTEHVVAQ